MIIAVIPARGGSKRIPRKNIRTFGGKPMIAWSIQAAIQSNCFDDVIVSTDDIEIAAIAKEHGAKTPFLRPKNLADDYTETIPVIAHAIDWQNKHGQTATEVCCIYATAPFLMAEDLQRGFGVLRESGADFAFSVTNYQSPIQRAMRITAAQRVQMLHPEFFNSRSQDLEETWHDASQFYWGKAQAWLKGKPLFSENASPVPIPAHRVQDIDTPADWMRAEYMFRAMQDHLFLSNK